MQRILSKNNRRQLALIELLEQQSEGQVIEDLAEYFNVTRQTITRDFEEINESFESVEIIDKKGIYRVRFHEGHNLQTLYKEVINNDKGFQIFEVIFYDENLSVENLAEKIGLSTSTVYKMIDRFREPLKEHFNVSMSTRPVRLSGSEYHIRSFYNHYFTEKYDHFTLKMDLPIAREAFDEFLAIAADVVGMDIIFTYHYFYKIVTAVNLTRYLQGHYLESEFKDLTTYIEMFRSNTESYQKICDSFPVELTDFAIYQVIGQFAFKHYCYVYEEYEELIQTSEISRLANQVLLDIIHAVEDEFGLECPNPDEMCWQMHNTATQSELDHLAIPILSKRKEAFAEEMRSIHPKLFELIKTRLIVFGKMMNVRCTQDMCNHFMFAFYTQWENLVISIQELSDPVKILVVSQFDMYQAQLIEDLLKIRFGKWIDVRIYTDNSLELDSLLAINYDMIVSNFMIEGLDERPLILVSDYLQPDDYTKIYLTYKQLQINDRMK